MSKSPALNGYSDFDDRLTRLEDSGQERGEKLVSHIASDEAALAGLKEDLSRIELKVDKVVDAVEIQGRKWVANEASAKTKDKIINWTLTVLGIIACSGILEFLIHH
jgi:hypothetical protein